MTSRWRGFEYLGLPILWTQAWGFAWPHIWRLANITAVGSGKVEILRGNGEWDVAELPSPDPHIRNRGSSFCKVPALHPCALSKGFALELMRRNRFPWGDAMGGSSACTSSTQEVEHPSPSHQQWAGGKEQSSWALACHHPVFTPDTFMSSAWWRLSRLYQPHLLFLHLSPADNVKNQDFPCTGDPLGQEPLSNSRGSVIPPPSPFCLQQDPSPRQDWQGKGWFRLLKSCCSFTTVPAFPLWKQAPGLPWPYLCFLLAFWLLFSFACWLSVWSHRLWYPSTQSLFRLLRASL